jgi:hypothetical protein
MFTGQHLFYREHGRRFIQREPVFPDVTLGIGAAEDLRPQKQKVYIGISVKAPKVQIAEGIEYVGEGKLFDAADFPKAGYTGQAIYSY